MLTDEELIEAYRAGDESAFSMVVERNLAGVYTFVRRLVGHGRDAEDITQDAFLKAWKNLKSYSPETARFKTWLMRIARNTAIDYLRKRKELPFSSFETADQEQPFKNLSDESPDAFELLARTHDRQAVEAAIGSLSPLHRETLLLYYGGDRTLEEVAAITGESINTIKSRHRRALAVLRTLLGTQE